MKNILIILSILLLSSPVIGDNHKGETLYLWFVETEMVWKRFGDKDTHPKYKGEVKDGKPNGLGIIIYTDGSKYVGVFRDGKPNGKGTYTFFGGYKIIGKWKDSKIWNGKEYDKICCKNDRVFFGRACDEKKGHDNFIEG